MFWYPGATKRRGDIESRTGGDAERENSVRGSACLAGQRRFWPGIGRALRRTIETIETIDFRTGILYVVDKGNWQKKCYVVVSGQGSGPPAGAGTGHAGSARKHSLSRDGA